MTRIEGNPTASLLARASVRVPEEELEQVLARLVAGVADAAAGLDNGSHLEIGLPQLRTARYRQELLGLPDEPFTWKPAFVRRSLGIAALRACADGRFHGPADAVGPVADQAVEDWRRTGWRTFHWEPWYEGLGAGGRAAVLAEAVTWATPVWSAFDWTAVAPVVDLGRPDDRWPVPGVDGLHLRGRSELRAAVTGPGAAPGGCTALLSVAGVRPGDGWHDELSFLALVAALASPSRAVPARVVGLWPEAGALRVAEVDVAALNGAVARVVDTVAVTVDATPAPVPSPV
jgi:hypothetical protein